MIFGLGSGLSFIYWGMKKMPFPFVGGRIRPDELTKNLAENIGFDLIAEETRSIERAWLKLKEDLSGNYPVGLKVDMFYLDYIDNPPHFAAHYVVACGFEDNDVWVADTAFKTIQRVSIDNLKKARSAKGPFSSSNLSFKVNNVPAKIDFPDCIKNAIRKNAEQMLKPPIKNLGVNGIRKFSKEILNWHKRSDNPSRDFESHYIMFEKGGTGGAGFRNLYSEFLRECFTYLKDENIKTACGIYSEVASEWAGISEKIKNAPESGNMEETLNEISSMINLQADKEGEAMNYLKKI